MAARPISQPDVVDSVLLLPVDEIDVGERLRSIDPVWAGALGRVMTAEGQRTPIDVCQLPGRSRWTLVAGGHRHAGAISAGMAYIKAIVVTADAAERRMREISENLWRKGLEPVERAAFIAQLVALHRVKLGLAPDGDGRFASAMVRWKKALQSEADDATETISVAYGWAEDVAEQLGYTSRTVRNDLLLHRRLPAGLAERLPGHPVLKNATQLRALAKLDDREQARVVDRLANGAKSVSEAVARLRDNRRPQPEDKRLSAFIGAWSRMSVTEKKGALAQLAGMMPAGFRIEEGPRQRAEFPSEHVRYREEAAEAIDDARAVLEGILEDALSAPTVLIDGDRRGGIERACSQLHLSRLTIAADGFEMRRPA